MDDLLGPVIAAIAAGAPMFVTAVLGFLVAWVNRSRVLVELDAQQKSELLEVAARGGVSVATIACSERPPASPDSMRAIALDATRQLLPERVRDVALSPELLAEVDRDLAELRASIARLRGDDEPPPGGSTPTDPSG